MKWSSKQPKTEGWYWWWANAKDMGKASKPTIVYIKYKIICGSLVLVISTNHEATWLCGGALDEVSTKNDLWVGPLKIPYQL